MNVTGFESNTDIGYLGSLPDTYNFYNLSTIKSAFDVQPNQSCIRLILIALIVMCAILQFVGTTWVSNVLAATTQ